MYKLPERRGGGGEVIWAMPERKHSFLNEVFPYSCRSFEQMFCRAPLPQVGRAVVYDVRPACVYLTKVLQTKTH